ncbi:hypothetical protein F5I97DRAFT_1418306 [Phlebopus sp. FC_14]|nr:hypothetical protein F5I97DRAFT_1418306 [Phlebopus sp. FC_14]
MRGSLWLASAKHRILLTAIAIIVTTPSKKVTMSIFVHHSIWNYPALTPESSKCLLHQRRSYPRWLRMEYIGARQRTECC